MPEIVEIMQEYAEKLLQACKTPQDCDIALKWIKQDFSMVNKVLAGKGEFIPYEPK